MMNILKVKWICQVIQNLTKKLRDWSNRVFGEVTINKLKNLVRWNIKTNKINLQIRFNIIHRKKKGSVKIHMVMKIKILIIRTINTMRIIKNLKNKANIMNHKIIKKIFKLSQLKNKIKTKMKIYQILNSKQPMFLKTHFWMAHSMTTSRNIKIAAINQKETKISLKIKSLKFQKIT